jgi:hypothetical protein
MKGGECGSTFTSLKPNIGLFQALKAKVIDIPVLAL